MKTLPATGHANIVQMDQRRTFFEQLEAFELQKKSQGVAFVLCLCSGMWGAHRFYLNRPTSAVVILLITIISLPLTLVLIGFVGLLVAWVWVVVDLFLVVKWAKDFNHTLIIRLAEDPSSAVFSERTASTFGSKSANAHASLRSLPQASLGSLDLKLPNRKRNSFTREWIAVAVVGAVSLFVVGGLLWSTSGVNHGFNATSIQQKIKQLNKGNVAAKDYTFESGLWPGEGRPVFIAKTDLRVFREASVKSGLANNVKIFHGKKFDFDQSVFRTIKPGTFKVTRTSTPTVTSYGVICFLSDKDYYSTGQQRSFLLRKGDSFDCLQYRAEGECIGRLNNEVVAITPEDNIVIAAEPITEWWVHAIDQNSNPLGWVLIDNNVADQRDSKEPITSTATGHPTPDQDNIPVPSTTNYASANSAAQSIPFLENLQTRPSPTSATDGGDSYPGERYPETRQARIDIHFINSLSKQDISYAINEMFARHGADFPKGDVRDMFKGFSWYHPRSGMSFDQIEAEFSDVEKANLITLGELRSNANTTNAASDQSNKPQQNVVSSSPPPPTVSYQGTYASKSITFKQGAEIRTHSAKLRITEGTGSLRVSMIMELGPGKHFTRYNVKRATLDVEYVGAITAAGNDDIYLVVKSARPIEITPDASFWQDKYKRWVGQQLEFKKTRGGLLGLEVNGQREFMAKQ